MNNSDSTIHEKQNKNKRTETQVKVVYLCTEEETLVNWNIRFPDNHFSIDWHDGLVVRASASRSGGLGFEPWPGHTKDLQKRVPTAFLSDARHSRMEKGS